MFQHQFEETEKNQIKIEDVNYDHFFKLLQFMYSDGLEIDVRLVFDILSVSLSPVVSRSFRR